MTSPTDETSAAAEEVAHRLARYAQTKDPRAMWPGLTEPARVAAARELERVTREVLAGRTGVRIDPNGLHDVYALAIAGHTTGMAPVLGRWCETGAATARAEVVARLTEYLAHARQRMARMTREATPAIDALTAAGLSPLVLKGFHTAHVYFEEPALRRMADVDLAVLPENVDAAETALLAAGFRPNTRALRPYRRDWIAPNVDERIFSLEMPDVRSRWVLEMHASLDRIMDAGEVARLDPERNCVETLTIAGRSVFVLRQPLLLLTLACHCSQELGGSRLLRVFEMVRVIQTDVAAGRLVWSELAAMVERTGAARFTYPALSLVEDLAPGTVDPRVLAMGRRASTWAAKHTVARLGPAGGSLDDRGVIRQFMWVRGPVSVFVRVLRVFWPASFTSTRDVGAGWRARLRRFRAGTLSLRAPNERDEG